MHPGLNSNTPWFEVLDALHCVTIIIDQQSTIHYVNRQFETLTGLRRESLVGQSAYVLCGDDAERASLADVFPRFFESTREERFTLPSAGGGRFPVVGSAGILNLPNTRHLRIITCVDISQIEEANTSKQRQYEFVVRMSNTMLDQALQLRDNNSLLEERVRLRTAELNASNLDAIFMLAEAAEAKDHHTAAHLRRVEEFSRRLARSVGFTDAQSEQIGYSSILHDVGKLHVPDHILNKPGPLTDDEQAIMREHTVIGQRIIVDKPFFRAARIIARHHHENFDGSGYPDKLAGDAIAIEARIVRVADVFDALTSVRPYKPAWSTAKALDEMSKHAGLMFDPVLVNMLKGVVDG